MRPEKLDCLEVNIRRIRTKGSHLGRPTPSLNSVPVGVIEREIRRFYEGGLFNGLSPAHLAGRTRPTRWLDGPGDRLCQGRCRYRPTAVPTWAAGAFRLDLRGNPCRQSQFETHSQLSLSEAR